MAVYSEILWAGMKKNLKQTLWPVACCMGFIAIDMTSNGNYNQTFFFTKKATVKDKRLSLPSPIVPTESSS